RRRLFKTWALRGPSPRPSFRGWFFWPLALALPMAWEYFPCCSSCGSADSPRLSLRRNPPREHCKATCNRRACSSSVERRGGQGLVGGAVAAQLARKDDQFVDADHAAGEIGMLLDQLAELFHAGRP